VVPEQATPAGQRAGNQADAGGTNGDSEPHRRWGGWKATFSVTGHSGTEATPGSGAPVLHMLVSSPWAAGEYSLGLVPLT